MRRDGPAVERISSASLLQLATSEEATFIGELKRFTGKPLLVFAALCPTEPIYKELTRLRFV